MSVTASACVTTYLLTITTIAGALRLTMWVVLTLEGETHTLLMLGDFLHTAFLADFVVIYFRSLASSGLGGFLAGSDVRLGSMEAAV